MHTKFWSGNHNKKIYFFTVYEENTRERFKFRLYHFYLTCTDQKNLMKRIFKYHLNCFIIKMCNTEAV
jgi:hypothetical protein